MYYRIIPLVNLPLAKSRGFTYSHDGQLPSGSVVQIDFAGKKIKGVIQSRTNRPFFKTKQVDRVIEYGMLTSRQLDLAKFISECYFSPLGVVLKLFVHNLTKKETKPALRFGKPLFRPKLTKSQRQAIERIDRPIGHHAFLLFGPASSGKTEVIMGVAEKMAAQNKQSLILVPEIFLAHQEIARYTERHSNQNVVFFHSSLKRSELSHAWRSLKDGTAKIVIATRMGIFLPFKDLGLLAIDEEQDPSYKQWDQKPFYHTREVAKKMSKLHHAKLLLVSGTPSVESIHCSSSAECSLVALPALKTKEISIQKPRFVFGNLRIHHADKKSIILTAELVKALKNTFAKKGIAYVLVPRRGRSKLVACSDCKKILVCPNCQTPLNHHGDGYRCLHCSFVIRGFAQCQKCKSFRLVDVGFGTTSVADTLKNIFPDKMIAVADQDVFNDNRQRGALMAKLAKKQIDLLVGTYAIAKGLDIKHASLACVLNADNWSGQADFRFDERRMSNLFQLAGRVNRPHSDQQGICLIQTYQPESKLWEHLKNWDWAQFAKGQLQQRKQLGYPPFKILVKLTFKDSSKKKVEKKTTLVYNSLLRCKLPGVSAIYRPYFGHREKVRTMWQMHILLKSKPLLSAPLRNFLKKLGNGWAIDIDPENIF